MFDATPAAGALDADIEDARADDTPPTPDEMLRDKSNAWFILTSVKASVVEMLGLATASPRKSAFA